MTDRGQVLVTGPTGTVGSPLLTMLAEHDVAVVAGAHDPAQFSGPAPCRLLDFERPGTFAAALSGIDRLFLMRPPAISDTKRYLRPFLDAAAADGVRQVVFLSLMGVNRVMPHWQVEQDLRASSMSWTFLRPAFFAQNLEGAYRADIREHDQIRVSSGRGRTSFIDTRDVAAVAALALENPELHAGQVYTLTGPEALDYYQVASMLSAELRRAVTYAPRGLLQYRRELRRAGLPAGYVNVQLMINVIARTGLASKVTPTLAHLLGRPATPLTRYLHDRRDAWLAGSKRSGTESGGSGSGLQHPRVVAGAIKDQSTRSSARQ